MIASPSLGFVLLGIAGVLGWRLLLKQDWAWMQRVRRSPRARIAVYIVYIGVVVLSMGLAAYTYPRHSKPTLQPGTTNVQGSPGSRVVSIGEANHVTIDQSVNVVREVQPSGILVPANEPDPRPVEGYIPNEALKIFLGPNVVWHPKMGIYTVLRIGNEDIIKLKCTPDGLYVSAYIRREDARTVAVIVDNRFAINTNNYYDLQIPDRHEFRVFDKFGNLALRVRYVNEQTVEFEGRFYAPNYPPLIATKDEVRFGDLILRRTSIEARESDPTFLFE